MAFNKDIRDLEDQSVNKDFTPPEAERNKDSIIHLSPDEEKELAEILESCGANNLGAEIRKFGNKLGSQELLKQADYIDENNESEITPQHDLLDRYLKLHNILN
jgi:hypothetical protein